MKQQKKTIEHEDHCVYRQYFLKSIAGKERNERLLNIDSFVLSFLRAEGSYSDDEINDWATTRGLR
jgi:hypothetical protein